MLDIAMASGNDVSFTSGRSGKRGTYSTSKSLAALASTYHGELLSNDGRARASLTKGETSVLNPSKKQKECNAISTPAFDVSTTYVTNTRGLIPTTRIKAPIISQTTTAPQDNRTPASPKRKRMTAASFFEEEEIICLEEIRGTRGKHASAEAFTSSPTVSHLITNTIVASSSPDPKILPEKIVLLIDRQDAYLKSFYYPNVLHIYDNKLNFGNAFSMIKKTENVFKNTLFVMLCGTMSALKQEINKECHLFLCKEPLYNYFMQDFKAPNLQEHLINEAKTLRKKITTMDNCDVIFSGVLPVRTDRAEVYEAERHYNQTGHQVRVNSSRCEGLYNELCAGLKDFNKWAKEDAELLGFPNWSLVDVYTVGVSSDPVGGNQLCMDLMEEGNSSSSDSKTKSLTADSSTHQHSDVMQDIKSIPLKESCNLSQDSTSPTTNSPSLTRDSGHPTNSTESNNSPISFTDSNTSYQPFTHLTEANGVTLTMECMLERRLALKAKVREIFLRVRKVTRTPKPPTSAIADAKKSDEVVLPNLKSHRPAAPNSSDDINVVVVGNLKHDNILTNLMDPFKSYKKVTLLPLQKLDSGNMTNVVSQHYSQVAWSTKTVWILCFGILDFIDLNVHPKCLNQQCKSHLLSLSVNMDDWRDKIESKVKETITAVNMFKNQLESGILSSTMLLIVPPMQMAVLDEEAFNNHQELHSVTKKYNLFICNKATYDLTKIFYTRLYEKWPTFWGNLVEGLYQKPMTDYILSCRKRSISLLGGVANICKIGMSWKKMMEEVINIALTKYPCILSEVMASSHLYFMPYISLIEPSPNIGKMLSLNLKKKSKEDCLFRDVVVMGNQLPAELDELCGQLSVHVVPQRVTFDEAGKALILKYQKLWPKDTLWVILTDILHIATLENLNHCVTHNCKEKLKAYVWDVSILPNKVKWKTCSQPKIKDVISKAKEFSESLTDNLGERSAVFLPPVTPVFLLHANEVWQHRDLHKWYEQCKKAVPVLIGRKKLKKSFMHMKQAWLKMLKPYLEKYPVPLKILELYRQGKEDWIKTLGNFLVYFANAKRDSDDAVFSDAEFSSGEETVMGEEDTEDLAGPAFSQPPSTVNFSTPSGAYTSRVAPVPAPAPSNHPFPLTSVSAFPPYPKIAIRQDLLEEQDITLTIPASTLEGRHWTITSETPVDNPETTENTQHKRPHRVPLEASVYIPHTSGNTPGKRPERTPRKTPVNTQSVPANSSLKAHHKTVLGTPLEVPVQQHQLDKETVIRIAQGPQQTVMDKNHLICDTHKGQLHHKAEEGLLISRTEENQLTPKAKKDWGTPRTRKSEVIPQASGTLRTEITARAVKGQASPRKKEQRTNETEKNKVIIMKKNLESQKKEKDQIPTADEEQIIVQSEDAASPKENQVIMERALHLHRRLTLTEDVDAEFSDESNGQWIILSETEEDHDDVSEEENSGNLEEKDSPRDLSQKSEQNIVPLEREAVYDHSKDSVTTVQTAAKGQPLVLKSKHSKDTSVSEIPDKSNSVVSKVENLTSKDSKDNFRATKIIHTKDSNAAISALDKLSKEANTIPTVSEHRKKSKLDLSEEDILKKRDATPAVDKCSRDSNTVLSTVDKNSSTARPAIGKHKKSNTVTTLDKHNKKNYTSPAAGEHRNNSNTEPSVEEKYKPSDTAALSAMDKHSKNSDIALPAMNKNCKNNTPPILNDSIITAPPTFGKHNVKRSTTPVLVLDKHSKNSNLSSPTPDKYSKNCSTVPSTMDNTKNSDKALPVLDKYSNNSNIVSQVVDKNKNSNSVLSIGENKKINTTIPSLDKQSKSCDVLPSVVDKTKNIVPQTLDEHISTSLALDKFSKDSHKIQEMLGEHRNTASPSLNKHRKTVPSALDESSYTDVAQFPCLAKSHSSHNKDVDCEASSEQDIPPDPHETEEDSPSTEVLSNTDSLDTIVLNNYELEQETVDECQPLTMETIHSKPCSENLISPSKCHFVENELSKEDFVIKETEFVMGGSLGDARRDDNHQMRRKRKLLFSNRSPSALSSSSANNSFDSDLMEDCFKELLEHLKVTFQILWHTYLLTPEAHPDFEEKLAEFCKQYKERSGGEAHQDSEHCQKAWSFFWKDWLKKQLQEEKQKSKQVLFENFTSMIKDFKGTHRTNGGEHRIDSYPKRVKVDEGTKEGHMLDTNCANANTRLPQSVTQEEENSWLLLQSPPEVSQKSSCVSKDMPYQLSPSSDQVKFKSLSVSPSTSKKPSHSINLGKSKSLSPYAKEITSPSHSLDFCLTTVSHCQKMISKINRTISDNETAPHNLSLSIQAKESSKGRVWLILKCFKMLSEISVTLGTQSPAVVPIMKSVLDVGVQSDTALDILSDADNVQVMKICSEKLRRIGEKAEGSYQEKLLQCSANIDELVESISISAMSLDMIEGLHIPTIAKLTAQKDTPSVLEFVKDALAMRNMHNPPKSLVNKLFLAVSTYHSIMATQSSPTIAVISSPGTS